MQTGKLSTSIAPRAFGNVDERLTVGLPVICPERRRGSENLATIRIPRTNLSVNLNKDVEQSVPLFRHQIAA